MRSSSSPADDPIGTVRRAVVNGKIFVKSDDYGLPVWNRVYGADNRSFHEKTSSETLLDSVVVGAVPGTPAADVRVTEQSSRPVCNCGPCQREAAARNAPIPYLRRLVAELILDALDGSQRGRGLQPIHTNSDVDEAAVAVLGLVQPELEQLASEARALRADKDIRQGALNGVLGRPASADYYGAVEDVAQLVKQRRTLAAVVEAQGLPLALLRTGVRGLLDQNNAMAEQIKALQAQLDQVPSPGACSCNPTLVVVHEAGSYCGDPQYEALHELLDAEFTSANLAGADDRPYGAASRAGDLVLELLDILRGKKSRLELPVTEVRLDGLVPDENLERLRAILRRDEPGRGATDEADATPPWSGPDPRADIDLFVDAVRYVLKGRRAGQNGIQRNVRVSFTKAGRLLDLMESWGLVSPKHGSAVRAVLAPADAVEDVVAAIRALSASPREEGDGRG